MRIKEFCDIRIGHAFRERLTNVPHGEVMIIQPKNISSDGVVSFGEMEPLRTDVVASRPLKARDVLVVNRGRFAATVFEFPSEGTWIVPSSILVLSVTNESVLPEYLALYFNSANGQKLFRIHSEQTTVPFISTNNLGNMDIPVPSLKKQQALIAFGKAVGKYACLSNRKQELLGGILNSELEIGNLSEKKEKKS